jgi:hypothetical protein
MFKYSLFVFRIYVYKKAAVIKTVEDMFKNYNIALNEKDAKLNFLRTQMKEYKKEKEQVFLSRTEINNTSSVLVSCSNKFEN